MHLERQSDPVPRIGYLQAADVLAGTHAFGAIVAGLVRRFRTGHGAYLDVSMLEAMIAAEDITYGAIVNGGDVYPGPRAGMIAHTLEGGDFVTQTVGAPQLWARLCEAMSHTGVTGVGSRRAARRISGVSKLVTTHRVAPGHPWNQAQAGFIIPPPCRIGRPMEPRLPLWLHVQEDHGRSS